MKKVLITGANGQLAKCIEAAIDAQPIPQHDFIFLNRNQLDLSNKEGVTSFFLSNEIDAVINCAAYTAVDKAEEEVENAFSVNADAVGLLAEECAEKNIKFIHVSTDYVFKGDGTSPYKPSDETFPLGVYGKSKREGEKLALNKNPNSIIVRTAWVYSQFGHNFLKTMLRLFKEKETLNIVSDQIGSPTNANDLAKGLLQFLVLDNVSGIYHYTNAGSTSWYGFAEKIKELTHSKITLHPIKTEAYPTPAQRPSYSVMDCSSTLSLGIECPSWEDGLKDVLHRL